MKRKSLPLFESLDKDPANFKPLYLPATIDRMMRMGATLVVSLSGGKDSQAMLSALVKAYRTHGWTGVILAVHAHLGRQEWGQSLPHCQSICLDANIPLEVVKRVRGDGDLVERWKERMEELKGQNKPFWSSSASRYCTSDLKRGPIDKLLRNWPLVISAEGLRGEESSTRAKKLPLSMREQITAESLKELPIDQALDQRQPNQRVAVNWYPIFHWGIEQVWHECGTSSVELEQRRAIYRSGDEETALDGWPAHPLYVMGNERVSCVFCVLASVNDLQNGARLRPELHEELIGMEVESGFTFKNGWSLTELKQENRLNG